MVRQVIDPATPDRAAWFAGMAEHAAEMIGEGADADGLARFEACANQWLTHEGVPDPPFSILSELDAKGASNG